MHMLLELESSMFSIMNSIFMDHSVSQNGRGSIVLAILVLMLVAIFAALLYYFFIRPGGQSQSAANKIAAQQMNTSELPVPAGSKLTVSKNQPTTYGYSTIDSYVSHRSVSDEFRALDKYFSEIPWTLTEATGTGSQKMIIATVANITAITTITGTTHSSTAVTIDFRTRTHG